MDTSIIVVIAIVVVFAVAVPAMIRKSATELSRAEIDTVPDNAAVVAAETPNPGHDHSERTQVFHDKPRRTPSVPSPEVSPGEDAPTLSLSASTPAFAVIDGHGQSHTIPEAAEHSQLNVLPVAVGETHSALSADRGPAGHGGAASGGGAGVGADNVRLLHPAVHAVFNDSSQAGRQQTGAGRTPQAHSPRTSATGSTASSGSRPVTGQGPRGGAPRDGAADTDRGGRLGEVESTRSENGPQISHPSSGTDEEHAMTEQATTLRESLKSLNTMVKGFALVFLASMLGILVSGVLALFSVVHIALAGVFLGLAVVSLLIVRTLNLRKFEVKKRLRGLKPVAPKSSTAPTRATSAQATSDRSASARSTSARSTSARSTSEAKAPTVNVKEQRSATAVAPSDRTAAGSAPAAPVSSGTAARIAAAAQGASGTTKAAQARAAMARSAEAKANRSTEAKKSREEADTGEIPLVRIRKEASEGHTTRQVLLTGPIPIVDDSTTEEAPKGEEEHTTTAETSAAEAGGGEPAQGSVDADSSNILGADLETEGTDASAGTEFGGHRCR